jgi:hypothetical protein
MYTKRNVKDKWVPVVAIISPVLCYFISAYSEVLFYGYKFGFEILILNGLITLLGLWIVSKKMVQKSNSCK